MKKKKIPDSEYDGNDDALNDIKINNINTTFSNDNYFSNEKKIIVFNCNYKIIIFKLIKNL